MDKIPQKGCLGTPLSCQLFLSRRFPFQSLSPEVGTDIESELGIFRTEQVRGLQQGPQRMPATETGRYRTNEVHTQVNEWARHRQRLTGGTVPARVQGRCRGSLGFKGLSIERARGWK